MWFVVGFRFSWGHMNSYLMCRSCCDMTFSKYVLGSCTQTVRYNVVRDSQAWKSCTCSSKWFIDERIERLLVEKMWNPYFGFHCIPRWIIKYSRLRGFPKETMHIPLFSFWILNSQLHLIINNFPWKQTHINTSSVQIFPIQIEWLLILGWVNKGKNQILYL